MKLEKGEYAVVALDADGYEITAGAVRATRKEAKKKARWMIEDAELVASGLHKTEVRNATGECLDDFFAGKDG